MTTISRLLFLLFLCVTASSFAATCRSGSAAQQGSQAGYNRDRQGAETTAQNDRSSSDILGRCVAGITAVMTAPQFPSLSSIFDQIKNRVCQIASDQVNNAVNDVNSQINNALNGINGQINNTGVGQALGIPVQVPGPTLQQSNATPSPQFWQQIWQ